MENFKKALNYAYLLLKYRQRSTKELIFRLRQKKFSEEVVREVINKLSEQNFLDDKKLAKELIVSLQEKGYGKEKIISVLRRIGLDKEEVDLKYPYEQKIKELLNKKIKFYKKNLTPEKLKIKIIRFLLQRGFDYEEIKKVLEENESRYFKRKIS